VRLYIFQGKTFIRGVYKPSSDGCLNAWSLYVAPSMRRPSIVL